ncbi:unnamed protein product [Amoebophrya sp. A25]|nr:unnamed protein product [Amoebophrya sp. A25]|eukprot:GSA25T00017446001.1
MAMSIMQGSSARSSAVVGNTSTIMNTTAAPASGSGNAGGSTTGGLFGKEQLTNFANFLTSATATPGGGANPRSSLSYGENLAAGAASAKNNDAVASQTTLPSILQQLPLYLGPAPVGTGTRNAADNSFASMTPCSARPSGINNSLQTATGTSGSGLQLPSATGIQLPSTTPTGCLSGTGLAAPRNSLEAARASLLLNATSLMDAPTQRHSVLLPGQGANAGGASTGAARDPLLGQVTPLPAGIEIPAARSSVIHEPASGVTEFDSHIAARASVSYNNPNHNNAALLNATPRMTGAEQENSNTGLSLSAFNPGGLSGTPQLATGSAAPSSVLIGDRAWHGSNSVMAGASAAQQRNSLIALQPLMSTTASSSGNTMNNNGPLASLTLPSLNLNTTPNPEPANNFGSGMMNNEFGSISASARASLTLAPVLGNNFTTSKTTTNNNNVLLRAGISNDQQQADQQPISQASSTIHNLSIIIDQMRRSSVGMGGNPPMPQTLLSATTPVTSTTPGMLPAFSTIPEGRASLMREPATTTSAGFAEQRNSSLFLTPNIDASKSAVSDQQQQQSTPSGTFSNVPKGRSSLTQGQLNILTELQNIQEREQQRGVAAGFVTPTTGTTSAFGITNATPGGQHLVGQSAGALSATKQGSACLNANSAMNLNTSSTTSAGALLFGADGPKLPHIPEIPNDKEAQSTTGASMGMDVKGGPFLPSARSFDSFCGGGPSCLSPLPVTVASCPGAAQELPVGSNNLIPLPMVAASAPCAPLLGGGVPQPLSSVSTVSGHDEHEIILGEESQEEQAAAPRFSVGRALSH